MPLSPSRGGSPGTPAGDVPPASVDAALLLPPSSPAEELAVDLAVPSGIVKKRTPLRKALRLFRFFRISSAGTVRTDAGESASASLCEESRRGELRYDDDYHHHHDDDDDDDDCELFGADGPGPAEATSRDPEAGSPARRAAPSEAAGRARSLQLLGRRHYAARRYEDAAGCHALALEELSSEAEAEAGAGAARGPRREGGEGAATTESDVLEARIRYDLSRSRLACHQEESRSRPGRRRRSVGLALAEEVRRSRRGLHRTVARHLEGEVLRAADPLERADLLRSLGRLYDERLGEYDEALRCCGEALRLERRLLARLGSSEQVNGGGQNLSEVRRALGARVEETRKMIGRLHYKRGEFDLAMQTSFVLA